MTRLARLIPLAAGAALIVQPALAQETDPAIAALVEQWIAEEGADFSDLVKAYGAACLTPVVSALPAAPRQAIVAAGGIEAGIAGLQTTDPDVVTALMPGLQECIETLFVGEQVLAWLQAEGAAPADPGFNDRAFCYMDAARPLPTEAKQAIVAAPDFEAGAGAVIADGGTVGTAFEERLEACD